MTFCADKDIEYLDCPIFNYSTLKDELISCLSKYYNENDIEKILYSNSKKLFNKLNKKENIKVKIK